MVSVLHRRYFLYLLEYHSFLMVWSDLSDDSLVFHFAFIIHWFLHDGLIWRFDCFFFHFAFIIHWLLIDRLIWRFDCFFFHFL
jgi:hypothetical protein